MKILVANDDGIFAPGIFALARAMSEISDDVTVVAPDVEQSASGHSITIRRPLRYIPTKIRDLEHIPAFRVDGTPADCVMLGVHNQGKPDIVVSGINIGANLGFDVTRSGTVAAAMEATTLGIPAIAFSLVESEDADLDFSHAAAYAKELVPHIVTRGLPRKTLLNVNFPPSAFKGVRLSIQTESAYDTGMVSREDPFGRPYFWNYGTLTDNFSADTDIHAVNHGYASLTPLHIDMTKRDYFETLAEFVPRLEQDEE